MGSSLVTLVAKRKRPRGFPWLTANDHNRDNRNVPRGHPRLAPAYAYNSYTGSWCYSYMPLCRSARFCIEEFRVLGRIKQPPTPLSVWLEPRRPFINYRNRNETCINRNIHWKHIQEYRQIHTRIYAQIRIQTHEQTHWNTAPNSKKHPQIHTQIHIPHTSKLKFSH